MAKIHLEKFKMQDFPYYYRLVSDEKVMAQITERSIPLEEAQTNFETIVKRNNKDDETGSYKITDARRGGFIGQGHVTRYQEAKEVAEIGYMILPEYWGKGYGTEIARLLVDLAQQAEIRKLKAIIDPENHASRKILLRQQFVSEKVCEIDGLPGEILGRVL